MDEELAELEEWQITLRVRVSLDSSTMNKALETSPDKWDYMTLLDLDASLGEQVWVEDSLIVSTGTEKELDLL